MCTLTWLLRDDGYSVFFNRDERRTRQRARPPEVREVHGVRFIAPRDADGGGTWALVNQHALAVCLLNRWTAPPDPSREYTSRGQLVLSCAGESSVDGVTARLASAGLDAFQPFTLVAFAPGVAPALTGWDGATVESRVLGAGDMPLTSSGYDAGEVAASRRRALNALVRLDEAALTAFHASHVPERGPYSTCMHRPEASTVSFSRIDVDPHRVRYAYVDGPPCEGGEQTVCEL